MTGFLEATVDWRRVATGVVTAAVLGIAGMALTQAAAGVEMGRNAQDLDRIEAELGRLRTEVKEHEQREASERAALRADSAQTRSEVLAELRELRAEIRRR